MKKIVFIIVGLIVTILPFKVKALTNLPFTVKDNNSDETQIINVEGGSYTLPTFCSIEDGCTLEADPEILKNIGKYYFGSGSEYFYIMDGGGIKIYEEAGPNPSSPEEYVANFNKVIIDANKFLEKEFVSIGIGATPEDRIIKLIATKVASEDKEITAFNPYLVFGIGGVIGLVLILIIIIIVKNEEIVQ